MIFWLGLGYFELLDLSIGVDDLLGFDFVGLAILLFDLPAKLVDVVMFF